MAEPERFYLVWGMGKPAPSVPHDDRMKADSEARRLALKHPGTVFVVMEPVEAYRAGTTPVEKVYLQYPAREAPDQPPDALSTDAGGEF